MSRPDDTTKKPPKTLTEDLEVTSLMGYRLVWSYQDHCANVKAYEVEAMEEPGDIPLFVDEAGEYVKDEKEAVLCLDGFIKWDGCSEFDFGRVHWCGPLFYQQHIALLRFVYNRAFELMGRKPDEEWNDAETP